MASIAAVPDECRHLEPVEAERPDEPEATERLEACLA